MKPYFLSHLRDLLKILAASLDLNQFRVHHVEGENIFCSLSYGTDKRQICPCHCEYKAFCSGPFLDHVIESLIFTPHTPHCYRLTLIKLHFYTRMRGRK